MSDSAALAQTEIFAANRAAGRIALEVAAADGVSRRTRVHEEGSLRVRFPGAPGKQLDAVLVNTAGGIAGGDTANIDIAVGDDASVVVTTASAEKIYRSLGPAAAVTVDLKVAGGASLAWMPRETILFDKSRLTRRIDVALAENARLLLAEAVVFGRSRMGEEVHHGWFSDRWRVRRGGRLIYAESVNLDGEIASKLAQPAVTGGSVAIATILMSPADDAFVAALRGCGERLCGEVGASTWNGITTARFCAPDGEALRKDLATALTLALSGPPPRLWVN